MADRREVVQLERADERVQVCGEGVPVIAVGWLARGAGATPVVSDDPVAEREQGRDLLVPGPAAERVAVDEDHRRAAAVVLVVKVDGAGVFGADGDDGHGCRQVARSLAG